MSDILAAAKALKEEIEKHPSAETSLNQVIKDRYLEDMVNKMVELEERIIELEKEKKK